MIIRLLALVLSTAVLTACTDEPAAPPAPDAKAVLAASTAALATGAYSYRVAVPKVEISGVTDVPHHRAMWTTTYRDGPTEPVEMRLLDDDQYSRTGTARWQHIDLSRAPKAAKRMGLTWTHADRTEAKQALQAVTEAKQDGQVIRGTLEGTRVPAAGTTLSTIASRLVKPVPFTASVDGQGRLTHLEIELSPTPAPKSEPAARWTLDITGYDTAADVQRPAGGKEMPDSFYATLES
ncbi:hypothetical protein [Actinoplanes sp. NPDC049316]|uniref:hypothetical protein n=1 Tax=Actinoplanes sp. NPDC049316 TaxID=3154727 RepID=UPI003427C1DB